MPSPAMPLTPAPLKSVVIDDRFWAPRIRINRDVTVPAEYKQCEQTGRVAALDLTPVPNQHIFWDSDIAKWIEAASYSLTTHPDPELDTLLDDVIARVVRAQQPDGYLNTYFTAVAPERRWTNLRDDHELYCAGHLIEAAVAHHAATGKTALLDCLCRYADYIGTVFGSEAGQTRGYCGHEEIELALVKLAAATGQEKYLRLSRYFVDERGVQPHYFDQEAVARGDDPAKYWAKTYHYNQSHAPVREQSAVTGHAVRGMYLYSAMADLAGLTSDAALLSACERIWNHLTTAQMYLTGGVGGFASNEGYGADFDLPNETAYAETCAAIGLVFWASRMANLTRDRRYSDVMERAMYNGVLSGVSLDGTLFFYDNPLASAGTHHRQDWFGCACCPPNIARLLASLGSYVYASGASEIAVHLYVQGQGTFLINGQAVTISQTTEYPWEGRVTLKITSEHPTAFALRLRLPAWCRAPRLALNGEIIAPRIETGYAIFDREWTSGDTVTLDLPMPVERVYANPKVVQDRGRVALQRGPMVYCIESEDNGAGLESFALPRDVELEATFYKDILGGVTIIGTQAERRSEPPWGDALYRTDAPEIASTPLTAIPYFAWDNRSPGEMQVWIRET